MKIVKTKSGLYEADRSVLTPKDRLETLRAIRQKIESKQGPEKLRRAVADVEGAVEKDAEKAAK